MTDLFCIRYPKHLKMSWAGLFTDGCVDSWRDFVLSEERAVQRQQGEWRSRWVCAFQAPQSFPGARQRLQGRSADCGAHQLGLYVMSRSPFSMESPFHSIFFMESKAWKDGSGSSCVFPVDPYLLGRHYTGKREEWLATGQRPPWIAINAFYFKGKPVEKAAKFWFQTSILIPCLNWTYRIC